MFKNIFKFISVVFLLAIFAFSQNSYAQLSGTYTIPGTPFATIKAAVDSLNLVGSTGGVTFNVMAGYTENIIAPITITATGTAGNAIIFQMAGVGANPLVTRTDAGTLSTSTLGGDGDAVIKLNGTDYITFNGIDVAASNQGIEYGYYTTKPSATDGCQFVTIQNCIVTLTKGTSAYVAGIYISNGSVLTSSAVGVTVTAASGMNSNVMIRGNTVQNVFAGILLRGSTAYYDSVITIGESGAGNIIRNFGASAVSTTYGVYFIYVESPSVAFNTIDNEAGGGTPHGSSFYCVFYSIVSGNIVGSNNTMKIANTGASSSNYYLYNANTGTSETYNNNTFAQGSVPFGTGSTYFIYASNATPTKTVVGNSTVGTITKGGGSIYCYYNAGGASTGGTEVITNNNFSNLVITSGSSTQYGIYSNTYALHSKVMSNNTISNITSAGTGSFYCFYALASDPNQVNNNNAYSITHGGGTLYGVYTTGNASVYDNNIYNISSVGSIYGMYVSGGTITAYRNQFYGLTTTTITTSFVDGIYCSAPTTANIYNNFVSDLNAPSSTSTTAGACGIYLSGGTTVNLYYNTVFLKYTSAVAGNISTALYVGATAPTTVDMRDNIFVNNVDVTTGLRAVAFTKGSTSLTNLAATVNNNDYYAGIPSAKNLIFFDGTNSDQTIIAYQTRLAPRESASVTENPPFVNSAVKPYDLHMNTLVATQTESGGTPVATVVVDYDGNARNATTPDIGADEFYGQALDLAPPIIVYTPLLSTQSTASRTLVASITDAASGVPTAGIGLPVLYWKINSAIAWTAATSTYLSGSNYQFTFGGGVVAGDTVKYYVVAQDGATTPNVIANPSAGAGGYNYNPPIAATPPTVPNQYFVVVQAPLAGDYTVGLTMFNQITGKNLYFEKVVTKVMKEVDVEVPQEVKTYAKGQEPLDDNQTSFKTQTVKQLMEVEEITWVPMENGMPYTGELFYKKAFNPEFNYPDGTDGTYATITLAVADLNLRGVSGAVNYLLNDTLYTTEAFPIIVKVANVNLPTSTNTVTIKPNTGVTARIQGAAAAGQIFKILTSYVNIDGSNSGGTGRNLTIENTSVTTPQVVVIGSTGTTPIVGNTLKNCIIRNGATTSTAVVVSDGTAPGTAGYFNNITIQNNSIGKAYMGVYNIAVMASGNGNGLLLTGNDLNTAGANSLSLVGLYVQGVDGATVSNNNIGNYTTTYTANITGVWFATGTVNSNISNNTIGPINITTAPPRGIVITSAVPNANVVVNDNIITGMITSYSGANYGIYVFSTTGGVSVLKNKIYDIKNTSTGGYSPIGIALGSTLTAANITVANNFIWDVAGYGYSSMTTDNGYGINLLSGGGYNVYFNSIALTTEQTSATGNPACLIINSAITTPASLDIRDNIFATFQTVGAQRYALLCNAANTVFSNINYNDWYSLGPNLGYIVRNRLDLDSLRAGTGQDLQSISGDPHYASISDLHINTAYNTVSNNGQYLAAVPTDIDNTLRSATTPDIGADEYVYVEPTVDDPTGVTATAISGTQIDVAFTLNASSNPVVIVFDLDGTFTTPSGLPPAFGQPFAGGTLIYNGPTSPYSHTPLNPVTPYYYKVFSYNSIGNLYSPGVTANATTPCEPVATFPLVESFDGTTFPPTCWANTQVSGSGLWDRVTAGTSPTCTPHSGAGMTQYASYDFSAGTSAVLVTPQITFPADDYRVKFWMYRDTGYPTNVDRVQVYYNTSPDTTGGTFLGVINRSTTLPPTVAVAGWYEYSFNMPTGSSGNAYIIFLGISDYGNNMFVDDVTVEQLPNFPIFSVNPASKDYGTVLVGNSVSQDFTITNAGAGTLTIIDGGITLIGTDASQFTIGSVAYPINLTAGQSAVVPVSFTPTTAGFKNATLQIVHNAAGSPSTVALTGRALPAGILFEDFTAVNALDRWTVVNLDGGANMWERLTAKYNSAPASAGSYYESSTLQNNDWLISPKLVVASGDSLMFWHSIQSTTYPESLYVKIGTTNDPTTGTWTNLAIILDATTTWKYKSYSLAPWAGQNIYVAFVNRSLDAWVLYVDDIMGPLVYVPAVDLALSEFYQTTGLPIPRPGENFTDYKVTLNNKLMNKPIDVLSKDVVGVQSSLVERTTPISYGGIIPFNPELANIGVKGVINNVGTNAASYNLGWTVGGVAQTPYVGPSVPSGGADTANMSYTSTAIGTFLTLGSITVTADENLSNNDNQFRLRVYPDTYTRTLYDRGDNVVDTYIGWGDPLIRMKAGVRFTAPATNIKLAGLDYICRTEAVPTGTWEIQVRDTSSSSGAPGAVLYSKVYSAADYFAGAGDYIFFPFDNTAPVIPAGDEYWITIKAPLGVQYPGGAHNTGFTSGHSYYEDNVDTTLWSALIITTERAWIMRSVEVAAATTFPLSVTITNGWNMVSIPGLHPTNQNVSTWWPGLTGTVWGFNGVQYVAKAIAIPGEGYWMKHVGPTVYNYPAIQIVPHTPLNTLSGWNMIGGYEDIVATNTLVTSPPNQITGTIWGFNGVQYVAANTLVPGYSYWVKLLPGCPCTITIPDVLAKGNEVVELFKEDWGRIILTDAAGLSYTLYAVKGEVDLDQYEMPPMPPAGMFDIRFSSGRIAEDINSAIQTIDMSGITYPLTVRVENMDIRLMDATGKQINVNLKAGEDIAISDATINKLMVSGELIPDKYALEQNYPNPFNPSTVIEFSLPEDVSNVKLSIYNVLGEVVAELVNTSLVAGKYSYQWNAQNVATGMYIYELRTDKFVSVKKMMLLK